MLILPLPPLPIYFYNEKEEKEKITRDVYFDRMFNPTIIPHAIQVLEHCTGNNHNWMFWSTETFYCYNELLFSELFFLSLCQ